MDGKPQPIIKHFVEDFGITKGCLRTCYWQTYVPQQFQIEGDQQKLAGKYMGSKKRHEPEVLVF
jgi:hypothetical protein